MNTNRIIGYAAIVLIIILMGYLGRKNLIRQEKPANPIVYWKNNRKPGEVIILTKNKAGEMRIEKASSILYTGEAIGIIIDSTKIELLIQK